MPQLSLSRIRRLATLVVAAITVTALAACGNSSDPDDAADGSDGGKTVSVKHAYGTTTIEGTPKRVVVLGWHGGDALLALGVVPVGIEADTNGADKDGLHPWFRSALGEVGGELPDTKVRKAVWSEGYDFERILSLKPDLIIAARTRIEKDEYDRLTQIAPTVGPLDTEKRPEWDEELRAIAPIFEAQDKAEAAIAETSKAIEQARSEHPDLDNKTVTWSRPPNDGNIIFFPTDWGGMKLLELFGMSPTAGLEEAVDSDDAVSLERLGELRPDVAIVFDPVKTSMTDPTFARWSPIVDGRFLIYGGPDNKTARIIDAAVSSPSVLSMPWLFEESDFIDLVEQALDGGAVTDDDFVE